MSNSMYVLLCVQYQQVHRVRVNMRAKSKAANFCKSHVYGRTPLFLTSDLGYLNLHVILKFLGDIDAASTMNLPCRGWWWCIERDKDFCLRPVCERGHTPRSTAIRSWVQPSVYVTLSEVCFTRRRLIGGFGVQWFWGSYVVPIHTLSTHVWTQRNI